MTRRSLIFGFLLAVAASLPAQILDRPVAVVRLTETVNIGLRQLESQLQLFEEQLSRQQPGLELSDQQKQQILDALVNDELLLQAATRAGIRATQSEIQNYLEVQRQQWSQVVGVVLTDEQFRQQVTQQTGQTWSEYVENVTNELIKLKFVQSEKASLFAQQTAVSEDEIRAFYDEQATSFTNPAMVSFRHVYVDLRGRSDAEREEARTLLDGYRRDIRNGRLTFEQLERQAIDDAQLSADNFGYLLRNDTRGQQLLGRSFVDTLFALEEGRVGGVYESNVALHIVLITDKRSPRILGLDDPILPGQNVTVRQQIRTLLASQKEQQALAVAVEEVVAELRDEAEITIFAENLPW